MGVIPIRRDDRRGQRYAGIEAPSLWLQNGRIPRSQMGDTLDLLSSATAPPCRCWGLDLGLVHVRQVPPPHLSRTGLAHVCDPLSLTLARGLAKFLFICLHVNAFSFILFVPTPLCNVGYRKTQEMAVT